MFITTSDFLIQKYSEANIYHIIRLRYKHFKYVKHMNPMLKQALFG